jgi:CBS-domain-containing membrane protein
MAELTVSDDAQAPQNPRSMVSALPPASPCQSAVRDSGLPKLVRAPRPYAQAVRIAVGGGLGLSLMVALANWADLPLEAVPFTTSIVLVMAAPDSGQAQPRNIIGGHLLSALSGLVVSLVFGTNPWLAGVALGLSIAAMQLTGTLHPPAGINALLFVSMDLSWQFVLMPVAVGALGLVAFAFLYHRLTAPGGWPRSWWAPLGR